MTVLDPFERRRFAHDIEWKVVGPMPVEEFLDEFSPISLGSEREPGDQGVEWDKINFESVPDSSDGEEEIYEGLMSTKRNSRFLPD